MNAQVSVNGAGGGGDFVKRGIKRDASDSNLSDFERFEKRLRMLSLREWKSNAHSDHYRELMDHQAAQSETAKREVTSTLPSPPRLP